ncbi:hypothetical protein HHL22_09460 [Hymenobacter sp. RP-2-7]|uniref:Cytochrome aa3 subunit 4 n=1 Tax=Hymenobacter polaris TaxID=2682546 RepID=A0A7Y0FMD9_9BACT|nr:hypothetical protein [Hymenobacter polaris]NML65430.1 hypothetical protein [Hymenobacter polaris]
MPSPSPLPQPQPADWPKARPERLPKPTYWPFFLAVGLAFIFWGLLTTWVILAAGLLIFAISLGGWINILRHEQS